jgi:hypothetical protein
MTRHSFLVVREDVVDSRLQGLDGAAYLAQLGVHFPFDVGLSHCNHWKVTAVYKACGCGWMVRAATYAVLALCRGPWRMHGGTTNPEVLCSGERPFGCAECGYHQLGDGAWADCFTLRTCISPLSEYCDPYDRQGVAGPRKRAT